MHNLAYKRMSLEDDKDIPQLTAVYQTPEIAQYLKISDNYFHYVTGNENIYFYKVYDGCKLVGTIHLEKEGAVLYMSILVFPEFQKTCIGTAILKDIQNDVLGLGYERIEISIDEGNAASLRLFKKNGFIRTSKEDELINYSYHRRTD